MSRKKTAPPREAAKPTEGGRTRFLPEGTISGFRRLVAFRDAALVSDLMPILDPLDGRYLFSFEPSPLAREQAEALHALDEVARSLASDPKQTRALRDRIDRSTAFALALDVDDPVLRWRAVVSRAFARADAVAWCLAEGIEDDEALVAWATRTKRALDLIEPEWAAWSDEGARDNVWGETTDRFDRAWRRRHSVPAEEHDQMREGLRDALGLLARRAALAQGCASGTTVGGRTPVTARNHFVLALATAYALATGEKPVFDGGDPGDATMVGTERKRAASPWHPLIRAALDLSRTRAGTKIDGILRAAAENPHIDQVEELAASGRTDYEQGRRYFPVVLSSDLPFGGLENDVGCRLDLPTTRAEAYVHPATLYVGRSRRG